MPDAGLATRAWRGIDDLAQLLGTYCWVENRIFEISGAWATGPGDSLEPSLRVWCAGVSRRHGLVAAQWAERLPVRAGVHRTALVTAPPGPLAGGLDALAAAADARSGVAAMEATVLPRLREVYGVHARTGSLVSEASVLEVLTAAHREGAAEIGGVRALLGGSAGEAPEDPGFGPVLERGFAETGIFPAVRTS